MKSTTTATTAKPTFNLVTSAPRVANKSNVKYAVKTTFVTSLSTIGRTAEVAYDVVDIIGNELKSVKLGQQLDQIDELVTEYGLSQESANERKEAILAKYMD